MSADTPTLDQVVEILGGRRVERGFKGSRWFTVDCPKCFGEHSMSITERGFNCRSQICGWAGTNLSLLLSTNGKRSGTQRITAPPSAPMQVARDLVGDLYTTGHGDLVLHDHGGDFHLYDGTCWPEIDRRMIRADAYRWLENAAYVKVTDKGETDEPWDPTRHKIDNVLDALRAVALLEDAVPPFWTEDQYDPPADEIVSMANGLLHVPSRKLYPHTPRFFTHHSLPFAFEPDAEDPKEWLDFLSELWPDDPSSIDALQEVFGYLLGGDTRQQKIFLLVGPRRGGKGTIGRVLTGLLGQHNVAGPTMASLSQNFGLQPLIGRPLALISDARLSGRADGQVVVERLLSISGEDSLTLDRKYKEPWTGRLPTRFMILTNELPRLSDSSGALASRFVVFVLTKSFLGREDPGLTDRLLAEAPGIFNWALAGLDRLNERGYFDPPESGQEAVQQLEDLASPVGAFVRDQCEVGPDQRVPVEDLWTIWKRWCESEGRHPGTKAVFGRDLSAHAPSVRRTRPRAGEDRRYVYRGIGLCAASTMDRTRDRQDQEEGGPSGPRDRPMYIQGEEQPDPLTLITSEGET
jgi:putative DNA primase/helicase